MKRLLIVVILCVSFLVPSVAGAATIPPAPSGGDYIADNADILTDEQETNLNQTLRDYENETTVELAVLTVSSIEDDYIENYSLTVAREWGIGQKDKNNGALLVVSVKDRKLRIEVGTGLEGDLTDSRSGQIIRNRITPEFRKGDYYAGIASGIEGMKLAINAEADPQATSTSTGGSDDWIGLIFAGAYLFLIVLSWFGAMLGRSKRWWPGGVMGAGLGGGLGALIGGKLSIALISAFAVGFFGLLFDYLVSKNYRKAKASGNDPSWWAGGGFGGSSSGGISGGFGGGGGFSGGGSNGSW